MSEVMFVNLMVMSLMMGIQLFFYFKINSTSMIRFPVMFLTTSFSLIITPLLMTNEVPTTPYLQLFFMVFQVLLFFFSTIEYLKVKRGK